MSEFRVKYKPNGFVYVVRAIDNNHAISKAIERTAQNFRHSDFKIIK